MRFKDLKPRPCETRFDFSSQVNGIGYRCDIDCLLKDKVFTYALGLQSTTIQALVVPYTEKRDNKRQLFDNVLYIARKSCEAYRALCAKPAVNC